MIERDVFSKETSDLDLEVEYFFDIGSIVGRVRENISAIIKLPYRFQTFDCSVIMNQSKSKKAYLGSYWKNVYDKLDQGKKGLVDKKTDEVFISKTKITRKLSWKKDRNLLRQKMRVRDCVTQNLFLSDKYSFAYYPTEKEMSSIRECAEQMSKIYFFNNEVCRQTFDIFRQIIKADIEREVSFFDSLVKYFLMTACFYLLNAALPIVATKAAGMLGKSLEKATEKASENLFVVSLNDGIKKYVEDNLDSIDAPKHPAPYLPEKVERPLSLTQYLIRMGIDIDMKGIIDESNEQERVQGYLISKMKEHSTDEMKKQLVLEEYLSTGRMHYEKMVRNKSQLYVGELGLLFANWINGSYNMKKKFEIFTLKNNKLNIYRDRQNIEVHDGLIRVIFPKIDQSYKEIYQDGSPLLFNPGSVKVDVICPLYENVTNGLQEVIRITDKYKMPGVWANPFDMPINKILHLKFKENIEIMILLIVRSSGQFNNYVPEYFYSDKKFDTPYGDSIGIFKPMWSMPRASEESRYNILKSLFSDLTVNPGILNFQLPLGENSLTTVKSATRDALMNKHFKLK